MTSGEAASEIRRAILYRTNAVEEVVAGLKGSLGPARPSLREALELVGGLSDRVRAFVDFEWNRNTDPLSRLQILQPILRHLRAVNGFVEDHFSHGGRLEISEGLVDEVRRCLIDLGLSQYQVVISHGPPDNYHTRFGDLAGFLYSQVFSPSFPTAPPTHHFALFQLPRYEGTSVFWRPVLLGHEVAHVAVGERSLVDLLDLPSLFDFATASTLDNPRGAGPAAANGLFQIARSWAAELLCDAHAVHLYGPAGVAALAEFFQNIEAARSETDTHPPGELRVQLMLSQLGSVSSPRLWAMVKPWADLLPASLSFRTPWVQFLVDLFRSQSSTLQSAISSLATQRYDFEGRSPEILSQAQNLSSGSPVDRLTSGSPSDLVTADIVNSAWVCRAGGTLLPVDRLALKSLADAEFLRRWIDAGGVFPPPAPITAPTVASAVPATRPRWRRTGRVYGRAILSPTEITDYLANRQRDRLVVTPLTHFPRDPALDVRLGTRFIVFRRGATGTFDPLEDSSDPRAIQNAYELSWSDKFVLHPNELVLGATLEYLVMPSDLTAQVITRSSYGRLGLISATAIQVHPHFHGCLTLELVNLGTLPISLSPGERIAQLLFMRTQRTSRSEGRYTYPTGPEFSKVALDTETELLRRLGTRP